MALLHHHTKSNYQIFSDMSCNSLKISETLQIPVITHEPSPNEGVQGEIVFNTTKQYLAIKGINEWNMIYMKPVAEPIIPSAPREYDRTIDHSNSTLIISNILNSDDFVKNIATIIQEAKNLSLKKVVVQNLDPISIKYLTGILKHQNKVKNHDTYLEIFI